MAHPNVDFVWETSEQPLHRLNLQAGATEFATIAALYFSAERLGGQLHSVANSQYRDPQFEDVGVAFWSVGFVHAGGAARKDDRGRVACFDGFRGDIVADNLTINILFAYTPSD